ncbi:MAG: hypothetical protein P4M01_01730 [Acidobacteriota bacterium]|nr:hypothetical protein [Acidobacteriota bacterium]
MTAAPVFTPHARQDAQGGFVELDGQLFYRIAHYDRMDAFFMSIVSASDHYLFISSTGGLTAGRRGPDNALFPYYTDDRIHESYEHTGSKTLLRVGRGPESITWEPFSIRGAAELASGVCSRTLYKSTCGNRVVFEEVHHGLELSFRYEWATSQRFGFVRTARLENLGPSPRAIEVLDGLQNLLPAGISRRFQLEYSTLVDGYKRTELDLASGVAMLQLTCVPIDRAEPSESLRANVAWSAGIQPAARLISSTQLDAFRAGEELVTEPEMHGRRGAYFINAAFALGSRESRSWKLVADVHLDTAAVRDLIHTVRTTADIVSAIDADVAQGTENLRAIVAAADGLQQTGDAANVWHHFASTMFNVMRGGLPAEGYNVEREDFSRFVAEMNRDVARRQKSFLAILPQQLTHQELLRRASLSGDADLERIAHEYLPLTFSRRHGDPSRPWNIFDIHLRDERRRRILNYQGNWRDIFQNWEALSVSYPALAPSMIFKFLDCSTADGYNPYRVTRDGCDWEVLEPHDSWSFIGYWGDHQVIYLLRLLEQAERCDPQSLERLLDHPCFSYVNVPYRIKPYAEILRDPQSTIVFDRPLHNKLLARAARLGADGKLLCAASGEPVRATLAEKLLLVLLTKLSNFVPGAGIWLNTQRPEWNDANNALVGHGASMVTVYYLHRYLRFVRALFARSPQKSFSLPLEIATWLDSTSAALSANRPAADVPVTDAARKHLLDLLGLVGSDYREQLYASGFQGQRRAVEKAALLQLLDEALGHVVHTIRASRRADGLYDSYNRIELHGGEVRVHGLAAMLEGQVAALSAGVLPASEALQLLDALRRSPLYRADQNSYILYPAKPVRSFLAKNNLPMEKVQQSKLLVKMLAAGDTRIVGHDFEGGIHFHGSFQNASYLRATLNGIRERGLRKLAVEERELICAIYEDCFVHRAFSGRSEAMYKYEGIGCIYWHMVSKLLVAAQEVLAQAIAAGDAPATIAALQAHYRDIRSGLGTHKPPRQYGAVPIDPYSHTPDFTGAQQPGMTGQAKEDFLARIGEMGVIVSEGRLRFVPQLITGNEFLAAPTAFHFLDVAGRPRTLQLEPGSMAFTYCQLPIVLHQGGPARIRVTQDGAEKSFDGLVLDEECTRGIHAREGRISQLDVFLALDGDSVSEPPVA